MQKRLCERGTGVGRLSVLGCLCSLGTLDIVFQELSHTGLSHSSHGQEMARQECYSGLNTKFRALTPRNNSDQLET